MMWVQINMCVKRSVCWVLIWLRGLVFWGRLHEGVCVCVCVCERVRITNTTRQSWVWWFLPLCGFCVYISVVSDVGWWLMVLCACVWSFYESLQHVIDLTHVTIKSKTIFNKRLCYSHHQGVCCFHGVSCFCLLFVEDDASLGYWCSSVLLRCQPTKKE